MIRGATLATLAALSLIGAPAAAAPVPPALLAAARLQGFWTVSGVVTKAVNVPGERPGARVTRTWAFVPGCPTSACPTLTLVRQRGPGFDKVQLRNAAPGVYVGTGSFYAPARCRGTLFRKGERVPYTIRVTITGVAQQPDSSVLATTFAATYRNPRRIGLTRCYSAPSYDSATYGAVPAPPPPAGAIRSERRMASSRGS
ncbi:MAG: hypothetical protein ACRDNK_12595 [Solirubrobacteraceae bacterium]